MTSNPHSSPSIDSDPRLLLPEWLRDEPQTDAVPSLTEVMPTEQRDDQQAPVSAQWEEPPAPIERFDPSGLITPDDLPAWIRGFVKTDPLPSQVSAQPGRIAESVEEGADPAGIESLPLASAAQARAENSDIPAMTTSSDLTETRFVLLAGAALIIILAVLASFYL